MIHYSPSSPLMISENDLLNFYIKHAEAKLFVGKFYTYIIHKNYKRVQMLVKTYSVNEAYCEKVFRQIEKDGRATCLNRNNLIVVDYLHIQQDHSSNKIIVKVKFSIYEDTR